MKAAAAVLPSLFCACAVFGQASITRVDGVLNFYGTSAYGANFDGSVVTGGVSLCADDACFILTPCMMRWNGETVIDMAHPNAAGWRVSDDGTAIVGAGYEDTDTNHVDERAYLWTAAGTRLNLGPAPLADVGDLGMNGDGSVVVGSTWNESRTVYQAFRWSSAGGMQLIQPGVIRQSRATVVSADGRVIGGSVGSSQISPPDSEQCCLWHSDGSQVFPPPVWNGESWKIRAINRNGTIVAGGYYRAVRWEVGHDPVDLGRPPGLTGTAEAFGMSSDGAVVVGAVGLYEQGVTSHAFIWTAQAGAVDLLVHLQSLGVNTSGWTLSEADGVSGDGSTIVGFGNYHDATGTGRRGFIARLRGPCGSADFNHDGDSGTDADIEAFFACIAGDCCPTCYTADFNGDGDTATDADIEAFFRVLAGGSC